MCEYIAKNTDVKVVIVGEGVDEVASSYLTNWYAPNGKDLHDTMQYIFFSGHTGIINGKSRHRHQQDQSRGG